MQLANLPKKLPITNGNYEKPLPSNTNVFLIFRPFNNGIPILKYYYNFVSSNLHFQNRPPPQKKNVADPLFESLLHRGKWVLE